MADTKSFSERIKEVRESLGLSQEAFARKFLVQPRTYQNIETGKTERLEVPTLAALIDENIDIFWLITGKESLRRKNLDLGELEYWQAEAKTARANEERAKATEGEAVASRSRAEERAQMLQAEVNRLKEENAELRARANRSALGQKEGQLMVQAGDLLRLPPSAGLEQILEVVVGIFSRARPDETRTTIHENGAVQKPEGDVGGAVEDGPRRANSS